MADQYSDVSPESLKVSDPHLSEVAPSLEQIVVGILADRLRSGSSVCPEEWKGRMDIPLFICNMITREGEALSWNDIAHVLDYVVQFNGVGSEGITGGDFSKRSEVSHMRRALYQRLDTVNDVIFSGNRDAMLRIAQRIFPASERGGLTRPGLQRSESALWDEYRVMLARSLG